MFRSISQKGLHRKTFQLHDEQAQGASLFPFFDDEGVVRSWMLVLPESSKIALIEPEQADLVMDWLGRKRMPLTWSGLENADESAAESVAHLWHYDPWWVLGEPRFAGHPAVPHLKGTNLPGATKSIKSIWFSKDLKQVTWYQTSVSGEPAILRFKPKVLKSLARKEPVISSRPSSYRRREEWTLRPFWEAGPRG